jgi:spore coat protein A, manganese oxidase
MLTRRKFLQYGAAAGVGLAAPWRLAAPVFAAGPTLLDAVAHRKFQNPLPNPLAPGFLFQPKSAGYYEIGVSQFSQSLGLVSPGGTPLMTTVWGYGSAGQPATYPGRTIVATSNEPIDVKWTNGLVDWLGQPLPHLLPVDTTVHWAFTHNGATLAADGVPTVTHVHGGHTETASDGLPEFWFTPGFALTGPQWEKATLHYDNDQEAGTVWYHDHALGITRLNVYAGLAGFYVIRDDADTGLADNPLGLPAFPYEVPIAIQDRMFTSDGQLFYPSLPMVKGSPDPSVLPEFFGDFILVNGQAWPALEVEPRQYRLRLLNGSDSRFYSMQIQTPKGRPLPITQVGTDGGLLYEPVHLKGAVVLGPGERADVVVDFSAAAGATLVLTNNAPTPHPFGDPASPTTRQLMAFKVTKAYDSGVDEPTLSPPFRTSPFAVAGDVAATRQLLLFESTDEYGRIKALLGTAASGGKMWDDAVTETVAAHTTEVWEIYNTTPDAHPIHLHLPQFEVLDRAPFKAQQNRKTGALRNINVGTRVPAPPHEKGPKDTVQMYPGQVTRIKAHFDRAGEYVWHCHILSHEDHEMMRRYEVV